MTPILATLLSGSSDIMVRSRPTAWWDMSDRSRLFADTAGTTAATDAGTLALIRDKSGNGNDASQATGGAEPVWHAAGYFDTDGVSQRIGATITWSDEQTWVFVGRSLSATSTIGRLVARGVNGGFTDASGNLYWRTNEAGSQVTSTTDIRSAPVVVLMRRYSDALMTVAVDGTQIMSFDPNAAEAAQIGIGAQLPSGSTNPLACRCYQFALWNRVLNDSEATAVTAYLRRRAGL